MVTNPRKRPKHSCEIRTLDLLQILPLKFQRNQFPYNIFKWAHVFPRNVRHRSNYCIYISQKVNWNLFSFKQFQLLHCTRIRKSIKICFDSQFHTQKIFTTKYARTLTQVKFIFAFLRRRKNVQVIKCNLWTQRAARPYLRADYCNKDTL